MHHTDGELSTTWRKLYEKVMQQAWESDTLPKGDSHPPH